MPEVKLTKREMDISRRTAQGKLNKVIADEFGIGNTVELMRRMQKVGL